MFKALFRSKILAFGSSLISRNSLTGRGKHAKLRLVGLVLLFGYCAFAFMSMFGIFFDEMAKAFFPLGLGWLYFTLFALSAFALMFLGSVFAAKAQLYEAKDNDLLLSLPIPPSYILGSRMLTLLLLNYLMELVVAAPVLVMWLRVSPASPIQLLAFGLIVLFLPLLTLAFSCLFGWVIELLTGRLQKNSLITVLFSLVFLGAYMYYFSRANIYIQQLVQNGTAIAGSLASVSPLFWIGNAIAGPDMLHLIFVLALCVLPFLLVYWVLSVSFLTLATTKRSAAKKEYKEQGLRSSSLSSALLRRELKRLLSSPPYMLNAGLGLVFILVAAVGLIVKTDVVLSLVGQLGVSPDFLTVILALGLCLMASTVNFTASAVSLEGKTLWIIKSLPVPYEDALRAKINLQVYLTIPPLLLAGIVASVLFSLPPLKILLLLLVLMLYSRLSANLSLVANLQFPKLEWINETQAVKQSVSVLISILYSSMAALLPGALYFLAFAGKGFEHEFLAGYALLLLLGWRLTDRLIMGWGVRRFEQLG